MKTAVLLICILHLFSLFGLSQNINWHQFDTAIAKKRNLTFLKDTLEQIKYTAQLNKNYPDFSRCWYYQLKIADLKSEDTAYFNNSYFIDSFLAEDATPQELKSIMHILQAKRIAGFRHQFFYKSNKNLFINKKLKTDYYKLSQAALDSLVQMHFEKAKSITLQLKNTGIANLLWLASDPLVFLFKPDFTDIVIAEQISYQQIAGNQKFNENNKWMNLTPDQFFKTDSVPKGIHGTFQAIYSLYRQWSGFRAANPDAFYFIESLARKYFNLQNSDKEQSGKLYEQYLIINSQSSYSSVKAHAIYQLALYWNELGSKYNNANFYTNFTNSRSYSGNFDSTYRKYFEKVQVLLDNNPQLLDSFFYLKQRLNQIRNQYSKPLLKIENSTNYLSGDSINTKILFRNVQHVYFKIYKLNSYDYIINSKKLFSNDLLFSKSFTEQSVHLPVSKDYQQHATKIKLPPLPVGYYAALYSINPIDTDNKTTAFYTFQVSNMAVINNDSRVFVLNRKTGQPLIAAKLKVVYQKDNIKKITGTYHTKTNQQGYANIYKKDIKNIFVFNGLDTIAAQYNTPAENKPEEVFEKDDEDLMDYYEDNLKLHLFTDRAIYRPGQTVHYKGIFIIRNPKTGEPVALNKQNLQFNWLRKLVDKEVRLFGNGRFDLYIQNPFGKSMDTIHLKCNKYGSFTGTYKIDEKAATGEWEFDTDYIDIEYNNNGHFSVEEYKRPSFELIIDKPKNFLQLGDSFIISLKVKSFAGAQLSNVKIDYDVEASFSSIKTNLNTGNEETEWSNISLLDSSGYTNIKGELQIKVSAEFLKKYYFSNHIKQEVKYNIHATAIDATGESHEADLDVTLDNRPVKINFALNKMLERSGKNQLSVTAKSMFSGNLAKQLEVVIYKLNDEVIIDEDLQALDYLLINKEWIYNPLNTISVNKKEQPNVVYKTIMHTDTGTFIWPKSVLETGNYKIEILCKENGEIMGEKVTNFSVFDKANNTFPADKTSFNYLPVNTGARGEIIKWYNGNRAISNYGIYHAQYFAKTSNGIVLKYWYDIKTQNNTLNEWQYKIPADAVDEIKLTHIYVFNNELYKEIASVYAAKTFSKEPEIIVEQYRKKLVPGSKETFVVSIKTSNENIAAELMTTMYDASLEKIEKHSWNVPNRQVRYYSNLQWNNTITEINTNSLFYYSIGTLSQSIKESNSSPLWWLNPLDYAYVSLGENRWENGTPGASYALQGRVAGVSITGNSALSEVVVVGYGTTAKRDLTGSVALIKIRGASSISSYNIPLVIIDGIVYEGDLSKIDPGSITDGIVLKGADALGLYGSRASNGVILLSTKGLLQLPAPEETPVVVRRNFEETAFFLPQVYISDDGFYNISFTIPESVTEWNWKMLAHTKKAEFFYLKKTIVTQLPLMVQPNMPRYLYQGDVINLQTRIINLDSLILNGTSNCIIEDVVTGQNITDNVLSVSKQKFTVDKKSNTSIAYQLHIPTNMLHPIKIKITARSGSFSDGEEYTIPILSSKTLVSKAVPFVLTHHSDTILNSPAFPEDAQPYGIGMYITPKPQAAMVNALPYLANYPYGCAEQTFNKMLAYSTAIKILQTDSEAQNTIRHIKSTLPKNKMAEALPDELSEQTMPWLQLNHSTMLHQQQLFQLFDTINSKIQIEKYINELAALQNIDGGITWFTGGKSSIYISNYLLLGFGKLKHDSLPFLINEKVKIKYNIMIPKLIKFCDDSLGAVSAGTYINLFHLNARRLWQNDFKLSEDNKNKVNSILKTAWENIDQQRLNDQALLISSSLGFKNIDSVFYNNAINQLESIRQLAISDNVNGLRWKDISNADDFTSNDEEIIANLALAFEENGNNTKEVNGIIQWLLQVKEQHNWSTTKTTAAIIGLLSRQNKSVTGNPIDLSADVNLQVTDNLFQGQLFSFNQLSSFPATITVNKSGDTTVKGGFNFYYLTATPPVNEMYSGVKISKQLQRLNSKLQWENIEEATIVKIADKLKTIITIVTSKQLKYVLIDEKRAATLEPVDGSSGYEYSRYFSYYKSVKDAGYQFFTEQIPSGISTIVYETIAAKEGVFTNGQISLQCMYQPALRAYGAGGVMKVTQ